MSEQEKIYVNRLRTILNEVETNIIQYNKYYQEYLSEQSNNCKNYNYNYLGNKDIRGNDLLIKGNYSIDKCKTHCDSLSNCQGFVFNTINKNCIPKASVSSHLQSNISFAKLYGKNNTKCKRLLKLMNDINVYLMSITLEAQNIVKNLKNIDKNYRDKYSVDMIKLNKIYNRVKEEKEIISNLNNDILDLDTQNKDAIENKKVNSTLVIVLSIVSILLIILSVFLIKSNNVLVIILTLVIITILIINIFSVTNI